MNSEHRRARLLAFLLDLTIPALAADAAALPIAFLLGRLVPAGQAAVAGAWIFLPAAAGALAAFLLRDARGGRARKWMALELRDRTGAQPGPWGSIRRNLPLLVPGWNLIEVWPVLRDGLAPRPSDRRRGLQVVPCD